MTSSLPGARAKVTGPLVNRPSARTLSRSRGVGGRSSSAWRASGCAIGDVGGAEDGLAADRQQDAVEAGGDQPGGAAARRDRHGERAEARPHGAGLHRAPHMGVHRLGQLRQRAGDDQVPQAHDVHHAGHDARRIVERRAQPGLDTVLSHMPDQRRPARRRVKPMRRRVAAQQTGARDQRFKTAHGPAAARPVVAADRGMAKLTGQRQRAFV